MKLMRFKKTAALLAAVGVVAVAGPATAAPPWVVSVGTSTTPVAFSAYTKAPIQFTVLRAGNLVPMSCDAASAAGIIKPGSYANGLNVAEIQGTSWSKCVAPGGIDLNVYHPEDSKWALNLTGLSGPTWAGYINNINARVKSKVAGLCAFTVTGRANGSFNTAQVSGNNNFTQTLNVNQVNTVANPGTLIVSNVSGCVGLVANGDTAGFVGSFKVYNPVALVGIS